MRSAGSPGPIEHAIFIGLDQKAMTWAVFPLDKSHFAYRLKPEPVPFLETPFPICQTS